MSEQENQQTDSSSTAVASGVATAEKDPRRLRGALEADVKRTIDAFVTGTKIVPDGKAITPHLIARSIKDDQGLDKPPSAGAVAAVMGRWVDIGFAEMTEKPFSFNDYTAAGRSEGLGALKERHSSEKRAARAAAKPPKEAKPKKSKAAKAEAEAQPEAQADPQAVTQSEPVPASQALA